MKFWVTFTKTLIYWSVMTMTDQELLSKYKKAYHQSIDDITVLNEKLAKIENHFRERYRITGSRKSLDDLDTIRMIREGVK